MYIFIINKHIIRLLKLEIGSAIPALNDKNYK